MLVSDDDRAKGVPGSEMMLAVLAFDDDRDIVGVPGWARMLATLVGVRTPGII